MGTVKNKIISKYYIEWRLFLGKIPVLLWDKLSVEDYFCNSCQTRMTSLVNVHPITLIKYMDLWKLWPTDQAKEHIKSDEQEAPSKLTEAQKEMVRNVRDLDKKTKGL